MKKVTDISTGNGSPNGRAHVASSDSGLHVFFLKKAQTLSFIKTLRPEVTTYKIQEINTGTKPNNYVPLLPCHFASLNGMFVLAYLARLYNLGYII
jgi:hypothetical protein